MTKCLLPNHTVKIELSNVLHMMDCHVKSSKHLYTFYENQARTFCNKRNTAHSIQCHKKRKQQQRNMIKIMFIRLFIFISNKTFDLIMTPNLKKNEGAYCFGH